MIENKRKTPREYMKMAIEVMKKSIPENRDDKKSPYVGAVLVFPDGTTDTAFRGELRDGDHAEYTVLDKKNRHKDLTDSWLFVTLEPCAPGARNAPKISCSERIINARISEVWFGIEDPDPKVDHSGIEYLEANGIKVHQFDRDLHKEIEKYNEKFLIGAYKRKKEAVEIKSKALSKLNNRAEDTRIDNLSEKALIKYLEKSKSKLKVHSNEFINELQQMELIVPDDKTNTLIPTGNAILLFGKRPRLKFPQAAVKAKVEYGNGKIDVQSFDDALVLIPDQVESWVKKVIPESFDRSKFVREKVPDFPIEVIDEAIINAIIHRDYGIEGAKVILEITPERIVIKSPGKPVPPIKLEDLQSFTATSISRNKTLAFIFNLMGYMEETGVGMDTYREMRNKYNLPLPIINYENPNLIVTFPRTTDALRELRDKEAFAQLNNEELVGYDFVRERKEVNKKEYAAYFGFGIKKAQRHLSKMKDLGLITDNGEPITSHNYRYVFIGNI
jgi:ATP-dependent DNA helicase RecG